MSKAVLAGRTDDTTLPLAEDVELLLGRRATGVRPGVVETDTGPIGFDGLVLATGSAPVLLPGPGPQRVLRTIEDALSLRGALKPGIRLAIVGAGWIGAEVATTAAEIGVNVTVVEAAEAPLFVALGAEVGGRTAAWYAEAGVDLRLGTSVRQVESDGLVLDTGEHLPADEVLVGVGVRSETAWLEGSGLALDRGIVVDEHLAAAWSGDGPPVVAVGDCAAWWSPRYGRRLRVQHWDCAQGGAAIAASTLLGGDAVYNPVPYFWSDQFGRKVQVVGVPTTDGTLIWRGDPAAVAAPGAGRRPGWSTGWFAPDGRLVALASVNRPVDMAAARQIIATDAAPDPRRFADITFPLRDLAAAA